MNKDVGFSTSNDLKFDLEPFPRQLLDDVYVCCRWFSCGHTEEFAKC